MMVLLDLDKLAMAYAEELHAEGMSIHDLVFPAAVLEDLARLAGQPTPTVVIQQTAAAYAATEVSPWMQ